LFRHHGKFSSSRFEVGLFWKGLGSPTPVCFVKECGRI
jgi:hypothetical protein